MSGNFRKSVSGGLWMGAAPSHLGTAQADLPPVEAWGESHLDRRSAKSRSPNGEWSSTLPSPRCSAQLIRATRSPVVPPKTEYRLTDTSKRLHEPVATLCRWAAANTTLLDKIEHRSSQTKRARLEEKS